VNKIEQAERRLMQRSQIISDRWCKGEITKEQYRQALKQESENLKRAIHDFMKPTITEKAVYFFAIGLTLLGAGFVAWMVLTVVGES